MVHVSELTNLIDEHIEFTRSRSAAAPAGAESWAGLPRESLLGNDVRSTTTLAIPRFPARGWSDKGATEAG